MRRDLSARSDKLRGVPGCDKSIHRRSYAVGPLHTTGQALRYLEIAHDCLNSSLALFFRERRAAQIACVL